MLTRRDVRDLLLSVAIGAGCAAATAVVLVHTVWSDGMGMP